MPIEGFISYSISCSIFWHFFLCIYLQILLAMYLFNKPNSFTIISIQVKKRNPAMRVTGFQPNVYENKLLFNYKLRDFIETLTLDLDEVNSGFEIADVECGFCIVQYSFHHHVSFSV